jgi:hypothetical protein
MYEMFSAQDLVRVSRHTMVTALIVGVVGLVGAIALGAPWVGLGIALGVGIGIANFRMIVRSVSRVGERDGTNHRRPLAANTLTRLGVITVIALGLCFLLLPLGLGVLAGLGIFQVVLLANMARSMFKAGSGGIGGMLDAASASITFGDDGDDDS